MVNEEEDQMSSSKTSELCAWIVTWCYRSIVLAVLALTISCSDDSVEPGRSSKGRPTSVDLGDAHGDVQRTVTDVIRILNHIVGNIVLTGNDLLAADVNANGSVAVNDA